jgi:hypothetical protein
MEEIEIEFTEDQIALLKTGAVNSNGEHHLPQTFINRGDKWFVKVCTPLATPGNSLFEMEDLFIKWVPVKDLQALGFNAKPFGFWNDFGSVIGGVRYYLSDKIEPTCKEFRPAWIYEQAFSWFREEHGLHSCVNHDFTYYILGGTANTYGDSWDIDSKPYANYLLAQWKCLQKLIELCKEM